jgi:hypothetical protein
MKSNKKQYNITQVASAVFLMLTLMWLTVSLPFVAEGQQKLAKQNKTLSHQSSQTGDEEATNPFGNTTEEKAPPSGSSISEEYLHDNHIAEYFASIVSQNNNKCENSGIYNAFHGEIHVPPPNFS